jgi:YtkA-like
MRHLSRIGAALAGLAALLLLVTGTALAGNFGEVTILEGGDGPPTAGEEREIRFVLLQHGVTPIEDGRVDVTLTNGETGDELVVQAVHQGDGIYAASVVFPAAGDWQVHVTHQWFATSAPTALAVSPAETAAWLPAALAIGGFAAAILVVLGAIVVIGRQPATAVASSGGAVRAEG